MFETYRMFPVNMALLAFVGAIFLFYKFVFPKKNVNLFSLLLVLSFLPVVSVLRIGVYESGDFALHLYRAIDFYNSLSEGNLIPSWAGGLNAGYGYPLFIFINPLPYYLISLFHFIGFSFIASMKLFLASSYILSGIFMYLFVKHLLKNNKAAFIASIFYLFSPYHLIDQHFRIAVGEILIFTTLPLLLLLSTLFLKKQTTLRFFGVSIGVMLIVLSHQAMAVFSLILSMLLFLFLGILRGKKIKFIILYVLAFFLGLAASLYSIYPYIFYTKYTHASSYAGVSFEPFLNFLYSRWQYGLLFQGPSGELATIIGYSHIIIVLVSIILVAISRKNKDKKLLFFLLVLASFFIFLLLPISNLVWNTIPLLKLTIITTRLLLFLTIIISILAGILLIIAKKKLHWLFIPLLIATIISSSMNWGARELRRTATDEELVQKMPISSSLEEGWGIGIPKWREPFAFEKIIPKQKISIINGSGKIKTLTRTSTKHEFITESKSKITILDNTWYFPGWEASIDHKKTNINYTNPKYPGLITLNVSQGLHHISITYRDSTTLRVIKFSSITIILIISIYAASLLLSKKRPYKF